MKSTEEGQSPPNNPPKPLSLDPTNPFEIVLAEQMRHLRADVDRLNTRLNWLFTLILGAAVTNVILAILQ